MIAMLFGLNSGLLIISEWRRLRWQASDASGAGELGGVTPGSPWIPCHRTHFGHSTSGRDDHSRIQSMFDSLPRRRTPTIAKISSDHNRLIPGLPIHESYRLHRSKTYLRIPKYLVIKGGGIGGISNRGGNPPPHYGQVFHNTAEILKELLDP